MASASASSEEDVMEWYGFASDNYAAVHPEVMAAIAAVDGAHQASYGADDTTARLADAVSTVFGPAATAYPVFNGTGANVVALAALAQGWQAVICADTAHIHVDEGGAPERIAGVKLWTLPTSDGKLTPESIDRHAWGFDDVHRARPGCVSISQATEYGTVYSIDEVRAITSHAHAHGMFVHMDGARLANAAAHLGVSYGEFTSAAGVDIVTFGGTKNGGLLAEAVVCLNPDLDGRVGHLRKTHGQLASKMRYLSAQIVALLTDDLGLRLAAHANAMASRLAAAVAASVELPYRVQANAVFAVLPSTVIAPLQAAHRFYTWDERRSLVRWMCSWDTTPEQVDEFAGAVNAAVAAAAEN